jgi:hypothetical protein
MNIVISRLAMSPMVTLELCTSPQRGRHFRLFSADYAIFLASGCIEDDKEGMIWIDMAAHMGSKQARAFWYRLQAACQ